MNKRTKRDNRKVRIKNLKYFVCNKKTKTIAFYKFKTEIAELLNVSTKTLDRKIPFETEDLIIGITCEIKN